MGTLLIRLSSYASPHTPLLIRLSSYASLHTLGFSAQLCCIALIIRGCKYDSLLYTVSSTGTSMPIAPSEVPAGGANERRGEAQ
jgi:hypothetical protein